MSFGPVAFSLLSGIEVSYESVERLCSDPEVEVELLNLPTSMTRRRGPIWPTSPGMARGMR